MSAPARDVSTVAVTGATGTLGGHVVAELQRRGIRVRALCRRPPPPRPGVAWIEGSLDDGPALDALVDGTDAILHLAYCPMEEAPPPGRSVAEHFAATNLLGTVRLIERAPRTRCGQLLFTSTLAVFGPRPDLLPGADRLPLDERFEVWPQEFYGAHKAALEKLLVAAAGGWGLNASVWRIGGVLGAYADGGRDPLRATFEQARDSGAIHRAYASYVVAADDVARILCDALGDASTRARVYHVFDRWLDHADLAGPIGAVLGREIAVACERTPERRPPLLRPALDERAPRFTTDAAIERLLAALPR